MGKDFGPARYLVYYVYMYVVVYITHMKTFFSTITYTLIVLILLFTTRPGLCCAGILKLEESQTMGAIILKHFCSKTVFVDAKLLIL